MKRNNANNSNDNNAALDTHLTPNPSPFVHPIESVLPQDRAALVGNSTVAVYIPESYSVAFIKSRLMPRIGGFLWRWTLDLFECQRGDGFGFSPSEDTAVDKFSTNCDIINLPMMRLFGYVMRFRAIPKVVHECEVFCSMMLGECATAEFTAIDRAANNRENRTVALACMTVRILCNRWSQGTQDHACITHPGTSLGIGTIHPGVWHFARRVIGWGFADATSNMPTMFSKATLEAALEVAKPARKLVKKHIKHSGEYYMIHVLDPRYHSGAIYSFDRYLARYVVDSVARRAIDGSQPMYNNTCTECIICMIAPGACNGNDQKHYFANAGKWRRLPITSTPAVRISVVKIVAVDPYAVPPSAPSASEQAPPPYIANPAARSKNDLS